MKRYRVIVSANVKRQIFEHVLYIAKDSLDNALAWEDRVRAAINSIGNAPGQVIDEDASFRTGEIIHKVVFEKTFLIFYNVNKEAGTVEVANFRHGARLP